MVREIVGDGLFYMLDRVGIGAQGEVVVGFRARKVAMPIHAGTVNETRLR
jgi:hypothetical protein